MKIPAARETTYTYTLHNYLEVVSDSFSFFSTERLVVIYYLHQGGLEDEKDSKHFILRLLFYQILQPFLIIWCRCNMKVNRGLNI